jgi:anaphase-promoting complex subunit 5
LISFVILEVQRSDFKQVLEGGNTTTIAQLYSILTDSHVGLAGKTSEANSNESSGHIGAAFIYLDRAHEGKDIASIRRIANTDRIQTAYVKVEDLEGTLDSLTKKAMLYKHRDDEDMIEEMERLYDSTVQEAERRQLAMQGQGV